MPSGADLKPAENIVCLAVGNAGSGKTSAIISLASKEEPVYVFDIDRRIKGVLGSKDWLGESANCFDYDQFSTRDGFAKVQAKFNELILLHDSRQLKYKTILIESVGSLAEMFLIDSQSQKGLKPGMDASKMSASDKKGFRISGAIAFPTPDDYHYGKRAFHHLFYNCFPMLPKCNIILSAWTTDRWGKDPNDENPYGADILLPGKQILATSKIANELPGYFDEIWEFGKEEGSGSTNPALFKVKFTSYLAKTSIPALAKARGFDFTNKNFKTELYKILNKESQVKTA